MWGRKAGGGSLCDPLEMSSGQEARMQEVVCFRARDETRELDFEEKK